LSCHLEAALRHTVHMGSESPPRQLDIFADSRDVMLRNDTVLALAGHDAAAAARHCIALGEEFPQDPHLPALRPLIDALRQLQATALTPAPQLAAVTRERETLEAEVAPAAHHAMGADVGRAWLLAFWCALAQRSEALAFDAACPEDHAAALWLRGRDWAAAAHAVQRIASWRRMPWPLLWMTHARYRLEGLDPCWPLIAELAWLAPPRLARLLSDISDPLLNRLRTQFDASFEGEGQVADLAWFPAWLLCAKPALATHLGLAQAGQHSAAETGLRMLLALLLLEKQGRHQELVHRRRQLRDLHAGLYAAYMATR
jgi:hypothetical protein